MLVVVRSHSAFERTPVCRRAMATKQSRERTASDVHLNCFAPGLARGSPPMTGRSRGEIIILCRQGSFRMDEAAVAQLPPKLGRDRRLHQFDIVHDLAPGTRAGENVRHRRVGEGELNCRRWKRNVVFLADGLEHNRLLDHLRRRGHEVECRVRLGIMKDARVERTSDDNGNVLAHAEGQDLLDGGLIEKRVAARDEKAVERACLSEIDQHLIDLTPTPAAVMTPSFRNSARTG